MEGNRQRLLSAVVAGLALLAAACGGADDPVQNGTGMVRISLASGNTSALTTGGDVAAMRDDRGRTISAAMVTFSSVLARNLDGQLVTISSALPVDVDLIAVLEGRTVELPAGTLPPGDYDQLVVVMTKVALTLSDGTLVTIEPPGGGWTAIVPTAPFTIVEGGVTTIELQLRRDAFELLEGRFAFDPEFDCDRGARHDDDDDDEDDDD